MINKYIFSLCLLIGLSVKTPAQEIRISADNRPLSEVLVQLRDLYGMAFSFDDAQLRRYLVTVDRVFPDGEAAVDYLLKNFPLSWEKNGEVYVIYSRKTPPPARPVSYLLRGQVVERITLEPLPYASLLINDSGTTSDENGWFNHRSTDSLFNIQVSYVGYYRMDTILFAGQKHLVSLTRCFWPAKRMDTILFAGQKHLVRLTPSVEQLEEVVITGRILHTSIYSDNQPGALNMNHRITRFLPGSSNNSVFNLLRLQPGISAVTESLENLIIWGSYEGQSRILFDGMVLFGLKNFNDNIGIVNPYVVKDIRLMKAAFGASYGDAVGGIAEITGKDGNRRKLSMDLSLDNYTVNTMLETPAGEHSSLILAFRHTYRSLYDNMNLDLTPNRETRFNTDFTIIPEYHFQDMNLKYTYRNEQDIFIRLSMMAGQDRFSYLVDDMLTRWLHIRRNTSECSLQKGASLVMGKNGKNGLSGQLTISYSTLDSKFNNEQEVVNTFNNRLQNSISTQTLNSITEARVKLESAWAVNSNHQLEGELSWVGNSSSWIEDTARVNFIDQHIRGSRLTLMAQDRISFGKFRLVPGIRLTYVPFLKEPFLEPRLSTSYKFNEVWNFSVAGGIYRQYLTKNSVADEYGNYRYMWAMADDTEYPVLRSGHLAASINLEKSNTQASLSPYYRKTSGLTRYFNFRVRDIEQLYTGHSRSYGLDIYLKQNFLRHTAWISYTISKTEESFDHFPNDEYLHAPHDQRHELKLAGMLDFDPVYFSASYVYGSGFEIPELTRSGLTYNRVPYHRLDAALNCRFRVSSFYGEGGISILNLLGRDNLLYHNLKRVPISQTSDIRLYQQSVPFTPTLYLKVGF